MSGNNSDADANAHALLQAVRHERGASSINVRDFRPDEDDFEHWVLLFEKAVKLATNVREKQALYDLFLEWLPLKLHSTAYATYRQAKSTTWPTLKEELIGLFIDPQERYKWQANHTTIKWDGKESFHHLAARIIQTVDKYNKGMPDVYKVREYFLRFRSAFKKPMRRVIDMGCPASNRTIEMAKEVALRYQLSLADDDGEAGDADPLKGAAFANANLHPDRARNLEKAMTGITTHLESLAFSLRQMEDRLGDIEDRVNLLEGELHRRNERQSDGRSDNRYNRRNGDRHNDRRNDDRRNDDRRNGDRRNDDRRNDDRCNNDRRNSRHNARSYHRNNDGRQEDENRLNYRDSRGQDDRADRRGQHRDADHDESGSESTSDEEPQGAAGYSRRR